MQMKIANLQIQKFRSIDNSTIKIDQISALVGANNAGKSHFLRALNAFFNYNDEKAAFQSLDHVYNLRSRPRITVTFTDIQPEDHVNPDYIYNNSLTIRFTYRWDRKNPSYDIIKANNTQTINADQFDALISHFRYIYVPIVRNYESAISGEGGIAYSLLKSIFQHRVANRNTIQPLVDRLTEKIKSTVFKSALDSIKRYYPLGSADFAIQTMNNEVVDLILRSVSLFLSENTQSNEINNCGSGIQSAVYFAISMAVACEDNVNYLVGIEEPELNMHPQAQRQLIETLKSSTKYPKTQFILTTHSTVIIDKLGHTSIALCRKSKVPGRDVVTTATQLSPDFWEKYRLNQERYYNFYQYKNSDFFFSNYIIITESPTDCNIIAALLSRYNIDIEGKAISLIPSDGEKSIKYPYALAKELGIPFICIVDRDVFLPYLANNRKDSLDENGIPQYRPVKKASSPIYDLLETDDLDHIINSFIDNKYNKVLELLHPYHIISMRYAIEVDLAICTSYCNAICGILQLPEENKTTAFLLKNRSNRIKDYDVITDTFNTVPTKNLPKSYKYIISCVKEMLNENS